LYEAAIVAGDASLEWTDGGVFLSNIDRRGSVKSLRGLRAQREPARDGAFARGLRVGPSVARLWVGGMIGKDGRGAWVQAVTW